MGDTKLEIGAMVVAIVGAIRIRFPKLDGLLVLFATMVLACALDALYAPAAPLDVLRTGIGIGLAAAGVMHLVSYGAGKFGDAMSSSLNTIPPPPMTTNILVEQPSPEALKAPPVPKAPPPPPPPPSAA